MPPPIGLEELALSCDGGEGMFALLRDGPNLSPSSAGRGRWCGRARCEWQMLLQTRGVSGPQALAAARGDAGHCPTASQARWHGSVLRGCRRYGLSGTWDEGFGGGAKVLMSQDCPVPTCASISGLLLKASLAGSSSRE